MYSVITERISSAVHVCLHCAHMSSSVCCVVLILPLFTVVAQCGCIINMLTRRFQCVQMLYSAGGKVMGNTCMIIKHVHVHDTKVKQRVTMFGSVFLLDFG